MLEILLVTLTGFLSALVQTTGGFGFGSLFVPLISLLVAYRYATFTSIITCTFLQLVIIIKYFKKIQWNLIIIPAIISSFTSYLGIHFMVGISSKIMTITLGIFLWILAFYLIFLASKIHLKKGIFTEIGVGALSGITGGMFAVGGPPMVAYYNSVLDDAVTYQATIQMYFFLTSIVMVVEDLTCIHVNLKIGMLIGFSILGCLIGTFIGTKILPKISMQMVRKIAYIVMLLAGTYNIVKGIF